MDRNGEKMCIFDWITDWYDSHCDGDWEHGYGINISTMDNPGISVVIDLIGINLENFEMEEVSQNLETEEDWYLYKIENRRFIGYGDIRKLEFLLTLF